MSESEAVQELRKELGKMKEDFSQMEDGDPKRFTFNDDRCFRELEDVIDTFKTFQPETGSDSGKVYEVVITDLEKALGYFNLHLKVEDV